MEFYSKEGRFLQRVGIDNTPNEFDDAKEVACRILPVPTSNVPSDGGIICLVYSLSDNTYGEYHHLVAYGDIGLSGLPPVSPNDDPLGVATCGGKRIDEFTKEDTTEVPGDEESYQRVGMGLDPEDFRWTVGEESYGELNQAQSFPICTTECAEGRYSIKKRGLFGQCVESCTCNIFVLFWTFLGWECGVCD